MCGIFSILGNIKCYDKIIKGLKILQNRGYDSAGLCSLIDNKFVISKFASDKVDSIQKLQMKSVKEKHKKSCFSISHTRWATHGVKSDINSHPHLDNNENFSIVHNGIIENYDKLKKFLIDKGYAFKSQTDTEVLVNIISYNYNALKISNKKDRVIQSIKNSLEMVKGTMGVCLLCKQTPDTLYIFRRGSPIVFSVNSDFVVVASEQSALQNYTNSYILPEENTIISFTNDDGIIQTDKIFKDNDYRKIESEEYLDSPAPFKHWTEKEINDIPKYIKMAVNNGGRLLNEYQVKLGGLEKFSASIKEKSNIIFLGCGSSLYATKFIEKYYILLSVSDNIKCINACEFDIADYSTEFLKNTIFILVSQSGETYDLIKVLNTLKQKNLFTIGIVNKTGSYIATNTVCGVYINSGNEIGVAATKSYINQSLCLLLVGIFISQNKNTQKLLRKRLIENIRNFTNTFKGKLILGDIEGIAKDVCGYSSMFILGTKYTEFIASEGSLKIKELSYIHSESYNTGELKHGPLSLIYDKIPVIYFCLKENNNSRIKSSMSETKIRNSTNILITDLKSDELDLVIDRKNVDYVITIPYYDILSPLVSVIPLQLLAYYLCLSRGFDPDKPRNLAKTVTVE